MATRAGRWEREEARRLHLAFLVETWQRGLIVLAVLVAGLAALLVFSRGFSAGVVVGFTVASVGWAFLYLAVVTQGTAGKLMGNEAEQWTSADVRSLLQPDWHCIDQVALNRGDADHVLVGPFGVVVIETKWSAAPWCIRPAQDRLLDFADTAIKTAERTSTRLRSLLGADAAAIPVTCVIVLWGKVAGPRIDNVKGVAVMHGHELHEWAATLGDGPLVSSEVEALQQAFVAHVEDLDARAPHKNILIKYGASGVFYRVGIGVLAGFAGLFASAWLLASQLWLAAAAFIAAGLIGGVVLRRRDCGRPTATGWLTGIIIAVALFAVAVASAHM
jgi:hypothetical protein